MSGSPRLSVALHMIAGAIAAAALRGVDRLSVHRGGIVLTAAGAVMRVVIAVYQHRLSESARGAAGGIARGST